MFIKALVLTDGEADLLSRVLEEVKTKTFEESQISLDDLGALDALVSAFSSTNVFPSSSSTSSTYFSIIERSPVPMSRTKLDRLTRSVLDLNRIVELLDENSVALVSMQESLDATTPTGRLTLNLLASVSRWNAR